MSVPAFRRIGGMTAPLLLAASVASAAQEIRIVEAARQRDAAAVAALLNHDVDVNASQPDGATALHWTAHWGDLTTTDLLLRAGAGVNARNAYGVTPLLLASMNGSAALVARLLAAGADPNLAHMTGQTPLMTSARTGSVEAVKSLLAGGANIAASEGTRGQTSLMWALAERHINVARVLLESGASATRGSKGSFTPLMFAAREGDIELAKLVLAHGGSVNEVASNGSTPLLVATVRGHVPLAKFFLEQGADPNVQQAGYTPLHWASGAWESITTHDYSVEEGEWSALSGISTRTDKIDLINALIEHGASVNVQLTQPPPRYGFSLFIDHFINSSTPFYLAALGGDAEVMRLLASKGANPTLPAAGRMTPLIVAAGRARIEGESSILEQDHLEAVRAALDLGNDVNTRNVDDWTALHAAAYAGFNSVVKLLVARGAELNPKTKAGDTPLKIAEGYVFPNMVNVKASTAALLRKLGAVSTPGAPTRVNENLGSDVR